MKMASVLECALWNPQDLANVKRIGGKKLNFDRIQRKGAKARRRIHRSADSFVRAKASMWQEHADKAVRAPKKPRGAR
jgi:hypothetical protein